MFPQNNLMRFCSIGITVVSVVAASVLAIMVALPWAVVFSMALVGCIGLFAQSRNSRETKSLPRWLPIVVALGSAVGGWVILFGAHALDYYYGVIAGLMAVSLAASEPKRLAAAPMFSLRGLGLVWGVMGLVMLVMTAYAKNQPVAFFASLFGIVLVIIIAKIWLSLPPIVILSANTLIILLVGISLADFALFPAEHIKVIPRPADRAYSYEAFRRDPAAYARWWRHYQEELGVMYRAMCIPDPKGKLEFVLRSNVPVRICENHFTINNLGFRGQDIAPAKGNGYRIVALGESTTFGITIAAEGRPWPEWLASLIQERLRPNRPVEVINAGVPSFTLRDNLSRLDDQILPLQPDLIISYHGYNEFGGIDAALPPVRARRPPPRYRPRPLTLLAKVEYRLRLTRYARTVNPRLMEKVAPVVDPLETMYADDYRELIEFCHRHGIRLVLATYSMAVNEQSDPDVQAFYHRTTYLLKRKMKANVVHSQIVKELARENPEIGLIDTQPMLDGQAEYFIDLMHFTAEGKRRLAETIFSGIKSTLEKDLSEPEKPGI